VTFRSTRAAWIGGLAAATRRGASTCRSSHTFRLIQNYYKTFTSIRRRFGPIGGRVLTALPRHTKGGADGFFVAGKRCPRCTMAWGLFCFVGRPLTCVPAVCRSLTGHVASRKWNRLPDWHSTAISTASSLNSLRN